MLFIISLFVLVGSVFTAVTIIYYMAAGVSCVADVVRETGMEEDEIGIHPDGENVNDVIELYEEVNSDEGPYPARDHQA